MTFVFTICSNNYLPQATLLGISLKKHNPDYTFTIGLVDRKDPILNYKDIPFEIVGVEQIGIVHFNEMFYRYNIIELNTAVKPFYFRYFLDSITSIDKIIYLDPDICIYNSFSDLEIVLNSANIVLTPHCFSPINDDRLPSENELLNAGLYNLGFIALRRCPESIDFLLWWMNRLENKAYIDFAKGMFTDQIWINFVPIFFRNVEILKHPGYNMAYWNIHERSLGKSKEVCFNGNSYPLVFYHFSGYNPLGPDNISKYQDRYTFEERKDLEGLFREYTIRLFELNYKEFINLPCYYDVEKRKFNSEAYIKYKRSLPVSKRIIRAVFLRVIRLFKVDIDYYTH